MTRLRWRIYWGALRLWKKFSSVALDGCERCGSLVGVMDESSRTSYHVEGIEGRENTPVDPNRSVRLCRGCAQDHHDYWSERWADYYGGRL